MMTVSMDWLVCYIILIVTLTKSCIGGSSSMIDSDYYYGNMIVRAGRVFVECEKRDKQYCLLKCGNLDFECINNKCVCVKAYKSSTSRFEMRVSKKKSIEKYKSKYKSASVEKMPAETFEQPILRHHIAHFCPDLDVARQCIRKCMSQGKPAFCGKDHVCYCSHKQKYPGNNLINATDVYTQFKDMYIKYFGPGIFQTKPTTETPKEEKKEKKKEKDKETDEQNEDEGGEAEGDDDESTKEDESEKNEAETEDEGDGEGTEDGKEAKEDEETSAKEGEEVASEAPAGDAEKEKEPGRRRIFILEY